MPSPVAFAGLIVKIGIETGRAEPVTASDQEDAMTRPATLQTFLDQSAAALRTATSGAAADAAARATAIWRTPGAAGQAEPARLPVCDWIGPALDLAAKSKRAALGTAFTGIADGLCWRRRSSAQPTDPVFWNGHANAMILGPGGLEERGDIWVGVTVMAPGVTYMDHDHPPEGLSVAVPRRMVECRDGLDRSRTRRGNLQPARHPPCDAGRQDTVSGALVSSGLRCSIGPRNPDSRPTAHSAG